MDEYFYKALQAVAARRQKAETLALQAQQDAARRVPQLAQMEQAVNGAGAKAALLRLQDGTEEAVAQAEEEMQRFARCRLALLRENGIAPESLQPQYACPLCRDNGKVNGKVCECVKKVQQQLRAEAVNKTFAFPPYRFEDFELIRYSSAKLPGSDKSARDQMRQIYTLCRSYANEFDMDNGSLFLYGSAGIGKTHLALSIAGEVMRKGYAVVYASAQSACAAMEAEKFGDGHTLQSMLDAQLLVLDDLGTEYITPFVASCLYNIVNTRCVQHLPTVYTSNIVSAADLARRYTEKVASRLLGECERLYCVGTDMRLQNR